MWITPKVHSLPHRIPALRHALTERPHPFQIRELNGTFLPPRSHTQCNPSHKMGGPPKAGNADATPIRYECPFCVPWALSQTQISHQTKSIRLLLSSSLL